MFSNQIFVKHGPDSNGSGSSNKVF